MKQANIEKLSAASPRYWQIASDIAAKIVGGQYQIGEKIYARSHIAGTYSVSSETARKAIVILADLGIVKAARGSGVVIISAENAKKFISQLESNNTLSALSESLIDSVDEIAARYERLKEDIHELVDHAKQFRFHNPLVPYEAEVRHASLCDGKNLLELNFWQNTCATVIAVMHGDNVTLSPGPYVTLKEGDVIYYVGEEHCIERVLKLTSEPGKKPGRKRAVRRRTESQEAVP